MHAQVDENENGKNKLAREFRQRSNIIPLLWLRVKSSADAWIIPGSHAL